MSTPTTDGPRLTFLGIFVVLLVIAGSMYGAWHLFMRGRGPAGAGAGQSTAPSGGPGAATANPAPGSGPVVEIGIAAGSEKRGWLNWAVEEFRKTPDGQRIRVNLVYLGSLEGAQAVLKEDKRLHVWAPASSLYTENFTADFQVKFGRDPILRGEPLALTPMVFVFWQERYDAFVSKYSAVNFKTIGQALAETGGWDAIAQKPEWGLFKFGHTHPNQSNSGLMTLVLMGYDYFGKQKDLGMKDILNTEFQKWLGGVQSGVTGLSNSTGNMMREMILKGPSSFDALMVYEANVIENIDSAQGRWGKLRVVYPRYNAWNDNPYYVLDVPWSNDEQRRAAGVFFDFLMSDAVQQQALVHGFRPANVKVPVMDAFTRLEPFGLKLDLGAMVDAPKADVLANMLQAWQRGQAGR